MPVDAITPYGRKGLQTRYGRWGKRAFDVLVASVALVILSPALVAIAVLSLATIGSPVLFRQRRSGRFGAEFEVLKFRSMRDASDAQGAPLPDEQRLTKLGRLLRASSLDELPSLINVLRGEMSIVGPRPLLVSYNDRYTPQQLGRLAVRPGITGLAQIRGRQTLRFSDRIEHDLDYVRRVSLLTDLAIILRTIPAVLAARGVINGQLAAEVDDLAPPHSPAATVELLTELRGRYS
jgi:lipopolysaccharide/colanic/teichoic acid biosynthesis glycosyltransferase